MEMDFTNLRNRIEQDANSILANDLKSNGGQSAYVVLGSETGFQFDATDFHGLYHSDLHKILQTDIGDRWNGAGPAVLVADRFIHDDETFVGICLHELAHAVDYPGMFRPDAIDGQRVQHVRRSTFANRVANPTEHDHLFAPLSIRNGHEWPWIRATLHLHHRFLARGWECPMPYLFDHEHYGYYANPAAFRRALEDEPERLIDVPLTELKDIDPPARFTELYDDCCKSWPDV